MPETTRLWERNREPIVSWQRIRQHSLENGEPTKADEFRFVFAIAAQTQGLTKYNLTGSSVALDPRHLLTAKHVARQAAKGVAQGPTDQFSPNGTMFAVERRFEHDTADLAVLRISPPIAEVSFPKLPNTTKFEELLSNPGTMVGFGPKGADEPAETLGKKLKSNFVSLATHPPGTSVFAVTLNTFATCRNDSGGPFLVGDFVVGIAVTSSAAMLCNPKTPDSSYYLRVDLYRDWILAQMNNP